MNGLGGATFVNDAVDGLHWSILRRLYTGQSLAAHAQEEQSPEGHRYDTETINHYVMTVLLWKTKKLRGTYPVLQIAMKTMMTSLESVLLNMVIIVVCGSTEYSSGGDYVQNNMNNNHNRFMLCFFLPLPWEHFLFLQHLAITRCQLRLQEFEYI